MTMTMTISRLRSLYGHESDDTVGKHQYNPISLLKTRICFVSRPSAGSHVIFSTESTLPQLRACLLQ
eukprot:67411-Hanusia_phi.AAC.1